MHHFHALEKEQDTLFWVDISANAWVHTEASVVSFACWVFYDGRWDVDGKAAVDTVDVSSRVFDDKPCLFFSE